ncbi:hypothetical protein [Silvanigrella sp.]|uniref:hypothetical protein n=1 Tax=Silvanigrella sp. TaxID=2024976 RepID=UPI0037C75CB1|nr:hypothetical protein [Silvanigrellaceae bacterium]
MSHKELIYKLFGFKKAVTFTVAAFISSCTTLPKPIGHEDLKESSTKKEIQNLLLSNISNEDFELLDSTNLLLNAFENLKEKKFSNAKEISKNLLYKEGLTTSLYKFAFKAYSISSLLSINEYSKKENMVKNFDFTSFQNDQCNSLCDSYGWKNLVQNESILFTPLGYNDIILSNDIFAAIDQEKPVLLIDTIFLGNNLKNKKQKIPKILNISLENKNTETFDSENLDSVEMLNEKVALSYFLNGEFYKSIELFNKIAKNTNDITVKSSSYYWIGRAYTAENNFKEAKKYYLMSGLSNPLGLYDSLSGQMIKNLSGRASTKDLSPFPDAWEGEMVKWIRYPEIQNNSSMELALKSVILFISKLKIENKINKIDDFQKTFQTKKNIEILIIKDEIKWLTKNWENLYKDWPKENKPEIIGNNIVWLNYLTGEYLDAILLVSKIKNTLDRFSENNNFLYFLFYPQFHKDELKLAVDSCYVDPDIMYSIFRQEGFFINQKTSYQETLAKVCNMKNTLEKYKNNVVNAISAYKAGVVSTDIWLQNNLKINDDAIFMEYIPDKKIKEFVQGVMKNYYNFKWIYFKKSELP